MIETPNVPLVSKSIRGAITQRHSCRAFTPEPVPLETIRDILEVARYAPSGTNTQPWHVYVVSGETRDRLVSALVQAFDDPDRDRKYVGQAKTSQPRHIWREPYLGRRRQVGWDLYSLLDIEKGDKSKMHCQHRRNMEFFDAPTGIFFTVDEDLGNGSLVDCGMFIQNVMLAAESAGLGSCVQAAFLPFHSVIAEQLKWPVDQKLVCGMSIGYADHRAVENTLRTGRESVDRFARFLS